MKNRLLQLVMIAGTALAVSVAFSAVASAQTVTKEEIFTLVNQERSNAGLAEVTENEQLNQAAMLKAQDMLDHGYFSHTSPQGVDPWHWFDEVGYSYKYAGENLAMDFSTAQSVQRAWMRSQTHRENILSNRFQEMGVAVLTGTLDNHETQIAVQLFGAPLGDVKTSLFNQLTDRTAFNIDEVAVYPWRESVQDELLVYAKVTGDPDKVEMVSGDRHFDLIKHKEQIYMNLVNMKEVDLEKDGINISAKFGAIPIRREVPKSQYEQYVKQKDSGPFARPVASPAEEEEQNSFSAGLNRQNIMLAGGVLLFAIMIVNVWVLENEEEKLLIAAAKLSHG